MPPRADPHLAIVPRTVTPSPFAAMLIEYRHAQGLSQNQLSRLARVDPAYVNQLERQPGRCPRRDVVLRLGGALGMKPGEIDRFLYAAGLATVLDWQALYEQAVFRLPEAMLEAADAYLQGTVTAAREDADAARD